ncbi:DUF3369 domain-containing protein [Neptunicella marina]|uniref:DUF3369 domain-containing protein n=1 Tax=Neptunicella marina TaxID=2125989 RepID=A0A8J6M2H2_9ALTE|nr:DUF3369 domain-containing protein [Neptunicella marina]
MSDDFLFAEETNDVEEFDGRNTWKILIVDDEPEIHTVTRLALSDFTFQERHLEFVSAYSGEEAKQAFRDHSDIAIVLLDVVMESDHAGLEVAKYIREDLKNNYTRIILRTGQPGQAPERDVIINYDINDYKSKTELTAQKLFTVIISTLRSYRDIVVIDESRQGLEKIIKSSANLFSLHSLEQFIEGIVQQLSSLLGGTEDAVYMTSAVAGPSPIDNIESGEYLVFSGSGEYSRYEGKKLAEVLSGPRLESCRKALSSKNIVYGDDHVVAFCKSKFERGALLYMSGLPRRLSDLDRSMIDIFAQNVQIAFDNVLLTKDIEDTQKEVIERLGQAIDDATFQQGNHIKRVILISEILGKSFGLSEDEVKTLRIAVPLHDIGKIAIPQSIINKPSKLSDDEAAMVKNHTKIGYNILKNSKRPVIKAAALIARDHHEHWDGQGYPRGLKGEEISVFSRITAIADVYDSLRSQRVYKESWSDAEAQRYMQQQRGKQFDPFLIDIFMQKIDDIEQIVVELADKSES